jgi:hypothetical protein
MSEETTVSAEVQDNESVSAVEFTNNVNLSGEVREGIMKKAAELKALHKLRKIFVAIVEGEAEDDKPYYIAYLRRPGLMHFSQYMNFVQKDLVQANKMLASNIFVDGDRELVDDDDLFLYGLMSQLSHVIDSRNAELVKK